VREVPVDVELSMEWAKASTLLRIVYAEVRPRARERVGVLEPGETLGAMLVRLARAVRVPVRPGEAEALGQEGERVGLWRVSERLVDGARWRFLVVPALPPSVERQRREQEEAERGPRNGRTDRQRQRDHRAAAAQARGPSVLPGAELPPGYRDDAPEVGEEPALVAPTDVTARSRETSVTNPPLGRDDPGATGAPPSLSGTPSGVPREGVGAAPTVAPAPSAAATERSKVSAATEAASWARALGDALSPDGATRGAALEALGRGAVAVLGLKLAPEVFNGAAATRGELRGLGLVLKREGATLEAVREVRGWLAAERHEREEVRSNARRAFKWDADVREGRAPVTVALLLGKFEGSEHKGTGWRVARKGSVAWVDRVRAAKVPVTFPEDPPGAFSSSASAGPGPVKVHDAPSPASANGAAGG